MGSLAVTDLHSFSSVVSRLVYGIACIHKHLGADDRVTLTLDRWALCCAMLDSPNVGVENAVYFILGEVYNISRLLLVDKGNLFIDRTRADIKRSVINSVCTSTLYCC
jgi:hypothetical protein